MIDMQGKPRRELRTRWCHRIMMHRADMPILKFAEEIDSAVFEVHAPLAHIPKVPPSSP